MKYLKALLLGSLFGIVLVKTEVISWFRIQEMFHFQSSHMYGVIGSAVVTGALSVLLLKKLKAKSVNGEPINPKGKPFNKVGNLVGGILFGCGWAMTGACPGPLYAIAGSGYTVIVIAILAALFGTYCYGHLKPKLPH